MIKIKNKIYKLIRKLDDFFHSYFGSLNVLFVVKNKFGFSCLLPILKAIESNEKSINVKIALEVEGCVSIPKNGEYKRVLERYYVSKEKAVWKKWHFVIVSDFTYLYFRRNHTLVMTSHGTAFGNLDLTEDNVLDYGLQTTCHSQTHIRFLNSINHYWSFVSQKPWLKSDPKKSFFVTGLSKTDKQFASQNISKDQFIKTIGLSCKAKNIVIFSHWKEKSLIRNNGMELIEKLILNGENFNIIINGHEKLWFEPKGGAYAPIGFREKIKSLENKFHNIKLITMLGDMADLLASADLFITDYSSVFIECCLADKPIIFFKHPEFVFNSQQVAKIYNEASWPFYAGTDIVKLCNHALLNPAEHKAQRKAVVDFFLDRQGTSANYIANILLQLGRVCGPTSVGWHRVKALSQKEMRLFEDET